MCASYASCHEYFACHGLGHGLAWGWVIGAAELAQPQGSHPLARWMKTLLIIVQNKSHKIKTKTTNSSRCLRNKRPFSSWGYFERFPPGPPSTMLKRAPLTPLLQNRAFILQLKKTHKFVFNIELGGRGAFRTSFIFKAGVYFADTGLTV